MKKILGIEPGSTRIKAILVDEKGAILCQGGYEWENVLADGLWSYPLEKAREGLQVSYAELAKNYAEKYGEDLTTLDAMGISAMMHGYLAFDEKGELLVPFRTWRNTNTGKAADELSKLFNFHIPMRWSVAQYYESVLEKMPHIKNVARLNTLAGYVHCLLSGEYVLGIDDASGMFPVSGNDYDGEMLNKFGKLLKKKGVKVDFKNLLPKVLVAGEKAGTLTKEGALLLDPTGKLQAGVPMCPPEGDMGTGMVATNCVSPRTANVSSGTSANLTVVLEHALKHYYNEVDIVASPSGAPAALIHTNNCTTEINQWVALFSEVLSLFGNEVSKGELFEKLFRHAQNADADCGKMFSYNFLAGEPVAGTEKGMPLVARTPDGKMNLANFMQTQIYAALSAISLGMAMLYRENVGIDTVYGHGGFYKTPVIGQVATSAALHAPVTVMTNAGEGGAWGMALLALFTLSEEKDLGTFLNGIFADSEKTTLMADEKELAKFRSFFELYKKCLPAEKLGSESIN